MGSLRIPPTRLLVYFVVAALLIPFCIAMGGQAVQQPWSLLKEELTYLSAQSTTYLRKVGYNMTVRKKFLKSDPLYITHQLSPLALLQREQRALESTLQAPHTLGCYPLQKRLDFLRHDNCLRFESHLLYSDEGTQATLWQLARPVEVDAEDVQRLLTLLDQEREDKPHLIVQEFDLIKRRRPSGQEVFELHLTILQREYV